MDKRVSTDMSLVLLTMSKALWKSIAMVNERCWARSGWNPWLFYVRDRGGRKRWSGWDGSHVEWVKEGVKYFWM